MRVCACLCVCVLLSWTSCKQKQALGKARAAELGAAPEGEKVEKLHSDSGVFLDSHSLQDSQPSKGKKHNFTSTLETTILTLLCVVTTGPSVSSEVEK